MSHRFMTMGALAVAAPGSSVAGQPKESAGKGIVPRIANGKPDLQGVWIPNADAASGRPIWPARKC
jgi:hypothetical protein